MKATIRYLYLALSIITLGMSACKKEKTTEIFNDVKGNYFSINQYILDEWRTHAGEPVAFLKIVTLNGKKDSSYTNVDKMDWPSILKYYSESDISDRKYLGKYTFSQFDDNFENTHNFLYTANNKDLFTQKLLICMDVNSMKVRGIYIETLKSTFWNECLCKLTYTPLRTIQIQQYDKPVLGSKRELVIRYSAVQ